LDPILSKEALMMYIVFFICSITASQCNAFYYESNANIAEQAITIEELLEQAKNQIEITLFNSPLLIQLMDKIPQSSLRAETKKHYYPICLQTLKKQSLCINDYYDLKQSFYHSKSLDLFEYQSSDRAEEILMALILHNNDIKGYIQTLKIVITPFIPIQNNFDFTIHEKMQYLANVHMIIAQQIQHLIPHVTTRGNDELVEIMHELHTDYQKLISVLKIATCQRVLHPFEYQQEYIMNMIPMNTWIEIWLAEKRPAIERKLSEISMKYSKSFCTLP
jgi:hypothetical protein